MLLSPREPFAPDAVAIATVGKALGHPARIAIVRLLTARTTCTTGELVAALPLSQSTVSQHLKALKAAGLVESTPGNVREGYALSPVRWAQVRQLFGSLLGELLPAEATPPPA